MMNKYRKYKNQRGVILVYAVMILFIFSMVMVGLLSYTASQIKLVRQTINREQAFQIAEAGANYYEWHLAHYISDYADGTGQINCNPCGPYVHNYVDKDTQQTLGQYSLVITPPPVGSTIVTVQSTG